MSKLILAAALVVSGLLPARAADRAVDAGAIAPSGAPQGNVAPTAPALPTGLGLPASVPAIGAPLSAPVPAAAPSAASAAAGPSAAAAPRQAQAAGLPSHAATPRGLGPSAAVPAAAPALPASAISAAASSRGPPAAGQFGKRGAGAGAAGSAAAADDPSAPALIRHAQEEARKLGTTAETDGVAGVDGPAIAGELSQLNGRGWSLIPKGALVTPRIAADIAADIDKNWDRQQDSLFNTWELKPDNPTKGWVRDVGGDAQGRGGARQLLEELTRQLQAALPGEDLVLRDAQLRLRYKKQDNDVLHVDGGYVTATITLKGPGTLLYDVGPDGRVRELEAPVGAVAVVTNIDRERATGVPGTVHSSPTPDRYFRGDYDGERWVLIVRYKRAGQPAATEAEKQSLKAAHDVRRSRAQSYRDRKNPKPAKPKKGFSLFGLRIGDPE